MSGKGLRIMYKVEEIKWEEIKKIWEQHLWPEKKGGVKPTNNWKLTLTPYSFTTIIKKGEKPIETNPYFFGIRVGGELVCVNSCFKTSSNHPYSYKGANWLWSLPRQTSFSVYEKVGFVKISDWFDDGQYGPNCVASKYL